MIATFIIAFFLLVAASYVISRSKRPKPNDAAEPAYFPPPARGLFDDERPPRELAPAAATAEDADASAGLADELRGRAAAGELEVLNDARLGARPLLYKEVLDTLVANVDASPEKLASLASFIARSDGLRATKRLAESLLRVFRQDAARVAATDLLRVAALADDASVFLDAVHEIFSAWRAGRLTRLSPADLRDLFDAEYCALAPETRYGGSAYVLKEQLAYVRRQLQAAERAARVSLPSTEPGES